MARPRHFTAWGPATSLGFNPQTPQITKEQPNQQQKQEAAVLDPGLYWPTSTDMQCACLTCCSCCQPSTVWELLSSQLGNQTSRTHCASGCHHVATAPGPVQGSPVSPCLLEAQRRGEGEETPWGSWSLDGPLLSDGKQPDELGVERLEARRRNCLHPGRATATALCRDRGWTLPRNSEASRESANTAELRLGPPKTIAQIYPGCHTAHPQL